MINDSTLAAIINDQLNNSIGGYSSDLEAEEARNLDYYYGRPYGDEVDGLSSVVTRDVLETIEWILPSLMRVFASGEKTVEFDPTGEEDEEQAAQETDTVNYVFNKHNNGYMVLHNWFKDTLLSKNGRVKVWIDEEEKITTETYEGLNEEELLEVLNQEGAEAVEQESYFESFTELDQMTGQSIELQVELFDVKIELKKKCKKVRVDVVPTEEIRVARNHNKLSLMDASFVAHSRPITQSELIGMGISPDVVKTLPSNSDSRSRDGTLEVAREQLTDSDSTQYDPADDSMREIDFDECYIRMDMDSSGRAKLWKVLMSGATILDKEPADFIPFPSLSSIPMPHQHTGLAEADLVTDLQRIRSQLMRGMLDNLYLTNNPEKEVVANMVNMDDLLTSRVGGIKRVKAIGSIAPLTVPFTAGASIPMLEILDQMREFRTGVGRNNMGLDADTLAQSTKGAFMGAMEQANQRIELLARTFAETGIKEMFLMIHQLIIKHFDEEIPMKLRGKYVRVNPLEWKERADMTVVVGLGTGNRDAEMAQLWTLAEKQEQHFLNGSPLVTPKNIYNTYARLVERAELKNVDLYWTDPDSPEAQQYQQMMAQNKKADPNELLAQTQMKIEQDKAILLKQKQDMDAQFKAKELELREREIELREHESGLTGQIKAAEIEAARYKADTDAETKLAIESMKSGMAMREAISDAFGQAAAENDAMLTNAINGVLMQMSEMREMNEEALTGLSGQFNQQLQTLAGQMNRPKRVIYDDDGNPIGVEPVMEQ